MKRKNPRAQITLEFLIAITAYILITIGTLQIHGQTQTKLEEEKIRSENYREISKTSESCTYQYFHGPSIQKNKNRTQPTETNQNKLIKKSNKSKIAVETFSPEITLTENKIKCKSIKPWYLK